MMSDGSLSQDEIDALLQGGGGFDLDEAAPTEAGVGGLAPGELAGFESILVSLTDSLASNLSGLVGTNVTISAPTVEEIANGSFVASLPPEIVQIGIDFTGSASGLHSLIFSPEIATAVAGLMMGQEEVELNEAALSALEEAGNTLAGAEATSFSEISGGDVGTAPGSSTTGASGDVAVPDGSFVKATYHVTVEGQPPAELTEVFDLSIVKSLSTVAAPAAVSAPDAGISEQPAGDAFGGMDFGAGGDLLGGGLGAPSGGAPSVQSVQFPSLGAGAPAQEQGNISLLMDVFMEMTVELGRTKKLIRDILGMGEGTIIELDKLAGEPVDILVNHKLIAKGEVVVIDENFGVRVTEIVDPMDRMPEM
jgi:flagellar motor switch protein FliN/FliY